MAPFNLILTKADFDSQRWEDVLAASKEPTCSGFCGALRAKVDEAKSKSDLKGEQIYALLHAASSLCLELGSPKQPFRPAVVFEKIRSAALEDFGPSDGAAFAEIAATTHLATRLRKVVSTAHIPDATDKEIDNALGNLAKAKIDWAVVYDVGQGNSIGLCNGRGSVEAYFDLGGGVLANAATFPSTLKNFCFTRNPPIILSHWDFDHWSSANRDTNALARTWLAPRQSVGPTHVALMTSIMSSGKLLLAPPGLATKWRGQLQLEFCNGSGRNHSGIALTLSEKPNGVGEQMLFPGDARYPCLPSLSSKQNYLSAVAPHHGADMKNRTVTTCLGLNPSRLVYSFGAGNTFSHPRYVTRVDHNGAGWHDPVIAAGAAHYEVRETANRGSSSLGHVLLGWKRHGTAPTLPCFGLQCQLKVQQL
jgi:hypothetical protein